MDSVVLIAMCIGLLSGTLCIIMLYKTVGSDERLDREEARQMRFKLLLFGPLGAFDILVSERTRTHQVSGGKHGNRD